MNNYSVVGAKNVASASTLRFFALLLSLLPSHAGSTGLTTPRRSILLEKMGQDGASDTGDGSDREPDYGNTSRGALTQQLLLHTKGSLALWAVDFEVPIKRA